MVRRRRRRLGTESGERRRMKGGNAAKNRRKKKSKKSKKKMLPNQIRPFLKASTKTAARKKNSKTYNIMTMMKTAVAAEEIATTRRHTNMETNTQTHENEATEKKVVLVHLWSPPSFCAPLKRRHAGERMVVSLPQSASSSLTTTCSDAEAVVVDTVTVDR